MKKKTEEVHGFSVSNLVMLPPLWRLKARLIATILVSISISCGRTSDNMSWRQIHKAELPAGFCVWLTTPAAEFLRGRFLYANWDVDELMAKEEEITKAGQLRLGIYGWDTCRWKWDWVACEKIHESHLNELSLRPVWRHIRIQQHDFLFIVWNLSFQRVLLYPSRTFDIKTGSGQLLILWLNRDSSAVFIEVIYWERLHQDFWKAGRDLVICLVEMKGQLRELKILSATETNQKFTLGLHFRLAWNGSSETQHMTP